MLVFNIDMDLEGCPSCFVICFPFFVRPHFTLTYMREWSRETERGRGRGMWVRGWGSEESCLFALCMSLFLSIADMFVSSFFFLAVMLDSFKKTEFINEVTVSHWLCS